MLFVQESVLDSVVAHLRLRMAGLKCVTLPSDADRIAVDAAVQEAQQLGATVSEEPVRQQCSKELCEHLNYPEASFPGKVLRI